MSSPHTAPTPAPRILPRVVGGVLAFVALVVFLFGVLLFPQVPDALFKQGGKAPLLLGICGVALMAAGYWVGERITRALMVRSESSRSR